MKTNMILSYSAPEITLYTVSVECGFGDSVSLPGFGTENDELIY